MGFGGTSPCAQKTGLKKFLTEHPERILIDGRFDPKPIVFGTNKHEGSFVLGGTLEWTLFCKNDDIQNPSSFSFVLWYSRATCKIFLV